MALKSRLAAVARKLKIEPQRTVVVDVPYFEPGPDARPDDPVRILVRNPRGEQRLLGSLREFYRVTTVRPEGERP